MAIHQKICIMLFSFIMAAIVGVTATVFFRAKKTPGLYAFFLNQALLFFWLYFGILEKMSSSHEEIMIYVKFTLPFVSSIGAGWLFFAVNYMNDFKGIDKFRKRTLLIFVPILILLTPLLSNKYFYLIIKEKTFGYASKTVWGPFIFGVYAITFVYLIAAFIIVIYVASKRMKNKKALTTFIGFMITPWVVNLLTMLNIIESPGFDISPISYFIQSVVLSVLIIKYQFAEAVPYNIHNAFLKLSDAVFFVDCKGYIEMKNESAEKIFNSIFNVMKSHKFEEFVDIMAMNLDSITPLDDFKNFLMSKIEYCEYELRFVNVSGQMTDYLVSNIPIYGSNRKRTFKIIVFRDITKHNERLISAERNRVSYDLHDSLGNSINSIRYNLEYAMKNVENSPDLSESIKTSYERSTRAYLELRRIVDNLSPIDLEKNRFVESLQRYVDRLINNGIAIELFHNIDENEPKIGETVKRDIFYICQEAITNSIVHGKTDKITITLSANNEQINLYIIDYGIGCKAIKKNKGLTSMETRIRSYNGQMNYGSPSEGGFNIKITIPILENIV